MKKKEVSDTTLILMKTISINVLFDLEEESALLHFREKVFFTPSLYSLAEKERNKKNRKMNWLFLTDKIQLYLIWQSTAINNYSFNYYYNYQVWENGSWDFYQFLIEDPATTDKDICDVTNKTLRGPYTNERQPNTLHRPELSAESLDSKPAHSYSSRLQLPLILCNYN